MKTLETVAFFDTKPYDKQFFDRCKERFGIKLKYYDSRLNRDTAVLAKGAKAVVAFVSDTLDAETIDTLVEVGVQAVALRSAGYNHVDVAHAKGKLKLYRVPAYSPNAVAEHAMALLLCLNRKLHRAYNRVREYNFALRGLTGFDLFGKTMGVIGTGKIGQVFMDICRGFGMNIIAYDPYPLKDSDINYVELPQLFAQSDIISLHCPLTPDTHHLINKNSLNQAKDGVTLINTSRGALIDTEAMLDALKTGKVRAAGLDVYEEESDFFYEDVSEQILQDDKLKLLLATPNVLITSHQGFLTEEALEAIAVTTLQNLADFFAGKESENEIQ